MELNIRNDSAIYGSDSNDWESAISGFTEQIMKHIGETNYNNIIGNFSTTTFNEKIASEVVLLESMQS